MTTLTEKAQQLWDWTVGELDKQCARGRLRFERVSVFQVRIQDTGSNTIDVVFSPGLNEWTARRPSGGSATFKVCESPNGPELCELDKASGEYSPCPKG